MDILDIITRIIWVFNFILVIAVIGLIIYTYPFIRIITGI